MKSVTVKVNNATQTIAEHTLMTNDDNPKVIKAVKHVNYELIDQATGHAPNHILTKRLGNDLHISFNEDGQKSDLIIEGFYYSENRFNNQNDSALIGQAEDGNYYYYTPDTGEVVDYVTELEVGDVTGQALGGKAHFTPWWVGASEVEGLNVLPWLVGLAGVGVAGAALGGGSSNSDGDSKPSDNNGLIVQATDLVEEAEKAEQAAEDALKEANKDGVITPEENKKLEELNQAVTEAKDKAQQAVDKLPESDEKTELNDRLDQIDGIVVPEILIKTVMASMIMLQLTYKMQ